MEDLAFKIHAMTFVEGRLQMQRAFPHLRFPRRSLKHQASYKRAQETVRKALLAWRFVKYPMRNEVVRLRRIKRDRVLLVKSSGFLPPRVVTYELRRNIDRVESTVPPGTLFQPRPVQHYVRKEEAERMTTQEKHQVVMLLGQRARERNALMNVRSNNDLLRGLE